LYAPTYIFLEEERKKEPLPYTPKLTASRAKGKGKDHVDADFDAERLWLLQYFQNKAARTGPEPAEAVAEEDEDEGDDGIECGCCFSTYPFVRLSLFHLSSA
jgi:E3 ubiquitin-protein ligase RNF216